MPRFGFNDQSGHIRAGGVVRSWVTAARIPLMVGVPMWTVDQYVEAVAPARPIICLYSVPPHPTSSEYGIWAKLITDRHNEVIIQAGNEPNNPTFELPVEAVRDTMHVCREYVRPESKVIGPGLSPNGPWHDFFEAIYPVEGVAPSIHLYPTHKDWKAEVDADIALAKAHAVNGVWHVTEAGIGREFYGAQQKEITVSLYKKLANQRAADIIFHSLTRLEGEWEKRQRLWAVKDDNTLTEIGRALKGLRT